MKKYILTGLLVCSVLMTTACSPLEKKAYQTIVAAKAFIDKEKSQHPECPESGIVVSASGASKATTGTCALLEQATAAKDALIDAAEVYCASPSFDTQGGVCTSGQGTPGADQAAAKLKSAIAIYNQAAADLKGIL